ncbi:MAG: hypothetical protein EOP05_01455 [Proteobacteria bacterium]|nr:MAG: hypothetical protein EOP05_01455 [Pseudomonadota bacterium]
MGSRAIIISKQLAKQAEARALSEEAAKLAQDTASIKFSNPEQAVLPLQKMKNRIDEVDLKARKLRTLWPSAMKFEDASSPMILAKLVTTRSMPPDITSAFESFKASFPKAYWGEGIDANSPIDKLDTALKDCRTILQMQIDRVSHLANASIKSQIGEGLRSASDLDSTRSFVSGILKFLNLDSKERQLELRVMVGASPSVIFQSEALMRNLRTAMLQTPGAIRKSTNKIFENRIKKLEVLKIKAAANDTVASKVLFHSNLQVLNATVIKMMQSCGSQSSALRSWSQDVSEKIADLNSQLSDMQVTPQQHGKAVQIAEEQLFDEMLTIQNLCRERSQL